MDLYYEAAVAGAIPLIRPLRESLAGDKVNRVLGIVNGTTNFILDKMDASGAGFTEALDEATPSDTPRPTRPPTSRASTPPPRPRSSPARLPHPGDRRRRLPRGHHRGHRGRLRLRPGDGLHHQAARHLRAGRGRRGPSPRACTRR